MGRVEEVRELLGELQFTKIGKIVEELGSIGCELNGFDAVGTGFLCIDEDVEDPRACDWYGVAVSKLLWLAVTCGGRRYAAILRDAVYILHDGTLYALAKHDVVGVVENDAVFTRVVRKEISADYYRVYWRQDILQKASELTSVLQPLAVVHLALRLMHLLRPVFEEVEKEEQTKSTEEAENGKVAQTEPT